MKSALPTPKKLPSGNWFIQIRINGHSKSFTGPKKSQVIAEAAAYKYGQTESQAPTNITLSNALDNYIESHRNVLSPSTIRGYRAIQKARYQGIMTRKLSTMTAQDYQEATNEEAELCGAKTLKNAWNFLAPAIAEATGQRYTVRLPQIVQKEVKFLQPEQIPLFVQAVAPQKIAIPALLALHSLRRSELTALTWEDIDLQTKTIHVRGSMVADEHNTFVKKEETKNQSSRRIIPILIPTLYDLLMQADKTKPPVEYHPNSLLKPLKSACTKNNLPPITPHGLRHSFASLCYHLEVPEKITMALGGWSNDQTMRKIYTHIANKDLTTSTEKISNFFTNC